MPIHVMCERDAGLFSLIQQVIANIPWALAENRLPVAYFRDRTCYWTPNGYQGRATVWEYYFQPLVPTLPASAIPQQVREIVAASHPSPFEVGYFADEETFVTSDFGDHPDLADKTLWIPYLWDDPDGAVRRKAKSLIDMYIRPRPYLSAKGSTQAGSGTASNGPSRPTPKHRPVLT
jgi:hypothetical protein